MYSVEEIQENYKSFSNAKIERIAKNDSKGLRKEVLNILKDEIEKRNLDKSLLNWVEAETNILTDGEKELLIYQIENLHCPKCLQKNGKLGGYEINRVISFLIYTDDTTEIKIICKTCGKQEKLYSMLTTLFASWWSKRGILITPYTLIKDSINLFFQKKISNRILNNFLEANNGLIRLRGTGEKALADLIFLHNNKNISKEE